jgi:putative ABC transport system permease protein
MNVQDISVFQLFLCLGFVLLAGGCSLWLKLGLEKDLAIGTLRTFLQLSALGYILKFVFRINNPVLILVLFFWMIFWAAYTVWSRVKQKNVPVFFPTFLSMLISYMIVTIVFTAVIVQVKPWYKPQYFIPLGGMIVGNSMNAIAVSLDRMFSDLSSKRDLVELALSLGADYKEATSDLFRDVIKSGMIPSINSLMTVGLVSLPGMMTGQILAGSDPMTSIKYQIVVMLMLVGSTAVGSVIVVSVVRRLCFTKAHQIAI